MTSASLSNREEKKQLHNMQSLSVIGMEEV